MIAYKLILFRIFNHLIKTEKILKNSVDKIKVRDYNTDTNTERTDKVHYIDSVIINFQFFVKEKEVRPPRGLI